jgi:hypothetical protein
MIARIDVAIAEDLRLIAADPPERRLDSIEFRLRQDPRRIKLAALPATSRESVIISFSC